MIRLADTGQQDIKGKAMDYITLAVEEIRKLSRELTAPQLKQGLTDSIRALVTDMNESSASVKFSFLYEGDCESASAEKKVTLFRIVQEQVKNILKHSKATVAGISLCRIGADFRLVIWDDGIGFNPHQVVQGIGLSNIQDRLSFYNGKVAIESAPGEGCKLIVHLPV
jgi:signal transduction histidine kinase